MATETVAFDLQSEVDRLKQKINHQLDISLESVMNSDLPQGEPEVEEE